MNPKTEDFRKRLSEVLRAAEQQSRTHVDIKSGDLHREVGGYPGPDHRMPCCCAAMRSMMQDGDVILEQPPKGKGANLIVRYTLPRS